MLRYGKKIVKFNYTFILVINLFKEAFASLNEEKYYAGNDHRPQNGVPC